MTSIKPGLVTVYRQPTSGPWTGHPRIKYDHLNKGFIKKYELSGRAAARVKTAVGWLVFLSDPKYVLSPSTGKTFGFRINLITLTLPSKQMHPDKEIKSRCLNQFLIELKRRFSVVHYIWKAEIQKNGNIHFHITTNQFAHYQSIREIWNRCVAKLGYLDRFYAEHGHWNPNSTDVHKTANVKDLASYLAKYMSKTKSQDDKSKSSTDKDKMRGGNVEPSERLVDGRTYSISHALARLNGFQVEEANPVFDSIWSHLDNMGLRSRHEEHYSLFYGHVVEQLVVLDTGFRQSLFDWFSENGVVPPRRFEKTT